MKHLKRKLGAALAVALSLLTLAAAAQTLPGTVTTSWVGNSFSDENGSQWVPDEVRDLCVAADGTVFTAGYSEAGGAGAEYKNGAILGKYSGFNSGFGDPVKTVVTSGTNVYWGGGNGVQVYPYGGGNSPSSSFLGGVSVTGLAVKSGELYISDFTNNLIRVYNLSTQTQVRQWSCTLPGKIVVDNNSRVWVIQYASGSDPNTDLAGTQILSFSSTGTAGPSITDVTDPLALALNNSNQLLVGGLDTASQVRIYGNLSGTPSLAGTFGTNGGIFSGTPGEHLPLKFHNIRGLGVDGSGNIYVCMLYGGKSWGQSVEAYSSSGTLLWQVHGLDYVECLGMDPASENDVYDHQHHYTLDYSQSNGQEWSFKGFTVNRFKYPQDDRVTLDGGFRAGVGMFRVAGKLFLEVTDQGGYPLNIYRFNSSTDGEVAIPSVSFSGGNPDNISRDANGNGQFDAGEIAAGAPGYYQYFNVTDNGGVLRIGDAQGPAFITYYPCQGLDSVGNPIYTAATSTTWNAPPEFSCIRKVVYDSANDIMYIGGNASSTEVDSVVRLCRYNNWSGSRTKAWDVTIPYNDQSYIPDLQYGGGQAYSVRQAGQYVFIQYGYGYIRVHDKDTGAYVGTIKPTINGYSGGAGQVDISHGMTAYRRSNGEYILFTENAGRNHVVMTRWNDGSAVPTVTTPTFSPAGGTYTSAQSVTISDATSGAAIHYTTDGCTPTASSATYSGPIAVSTTKTIKAIATKSGSTNSAVASATYTINSGGTEAAYNGPHNLPGTLQAEDYDTGGEGVAYHDTDTGNNGGAYRSDNVDIEGTTDTGGGYDVGWTAAGEYLKYTVNVATAGSYTVGFRVASTSAGNTFHLENSTGTNLSGTVTCPNTGDWQTWQTVTATVTLPAGTQILKLVEDTGGYNFNSLTFTAAGVTLPTPLIKLALNENTGTSAANTGSIGGSLTRTTPTPAWSTTVPATVGGASSLDFGTAAGNYGLDSSGALAGLKSLSKFTITGWVNCKNSTEGGGGNRIVTWINNGSDGVDLVYKTDGSLNMGVNQWPDGASGTPRSSAGKITTDAAASAGNWRFFAVTYDGTTATSNVKFYFGTNTTDATLDVTKSYGQGTVGSSTGPLTIGHFNTLTRSGATDRIFRGLIDNVRVYSSVLTAAQVVADQRH